MKRGFSVLLVFVVLAFASIAFAETEFANRKGRDDPEEKYKECLERCERRRLGRSFQEHCRDDCKVRREQTEERREQERGGGGGDQGRREEQRRRQEEQEREQEERRREEQEKGGRGGRREEQERRQEEQERAREQEERRREEQEKGGRGRREEQQRRQEEQERAREQEERRRKEQEKGSGRQGREEQQQRRQQERAREEEERARRQEEHQEEGDNFIREVTSRGRQQKEQEKESAGQEEEKNPYVFEDRHFETIFENENGRERVLPKFTERSNLFKGIQNYRLLIAEAEPQTFVLPRYYDADTVFFVAQGQGSVSFVQKNKRESFNVKRGDVGVLPSGTTVYITNPSRNEKLVAAMFLNPVNTPGRFESFSGAGDESFYRAFSTEILEAAFNTRRDQFEWIYGQQRTERRQGGIVKATEEQIKRLSQQEEEKGGEFWPFGKGESKNSFVNIFKQQPIQSNQYGQLFRVDGSKVRFLEDLDVAVFVTNISRGGMSPVMYNSRATKIAIVSKGEGYIEMACPHLSQQSSEGRQQGRQREGSPSYKKVRAQLRPGVAVVIPAGHPLVLVASENQNLELVSFAININNNEGFTLAGKANVINKFEKTAKELAFGVPASEIEKVFGNQKEEFFFKGPSQMQPRGKGEGRRESGDA